MAKPPADFHSGVMDAHKARCLQLSTFMPPFNQYGFRPYRVPDHLDHSRHPVMMPPQQPNRALPMRATSFEGWQNPPTVRAPCQPSYATTVNAHVTCTQYNSSVASNPMFTPKSTDLGTSYLAANQAPEIPEPFDSALNLDQAFGKTFDVENFGLGLGPLGTEISPVTVSDFDAEGFACILPAEQEMMNFEPESPEGCSWSSISDSGSGLISEFPEHFAETRKGSINTEIIPSLNSVLSGNRAVELPRRRPVKPASRGVTESALHARYRTSPYPTPSGRGRSMSAGSVALRSQRGSVYGHSASPSTPVDCSPFQLMSDMNMFFSSHPPVLPPSSYDHGSWFLPSPAKGSECGTTCTTHASPEIVNILHSSNTVRVHSDHQFAGSSSPPNLFGPLQDDQLSPPPEDLDCKDPELPRAQELRFEGDLYTPKYVRGHGNKREGWCGICKPGRWLVLKNSAFWYDKSFTHGISAATGSAFESPKETRRMKGNPDVWEGLCHGCGDWIALISSKKKGTTWFRHAYKCHTHQKVKDTPKRRREVSHAKATQLSKTTLAETVKSSMAIQAPDTALISIKEETGSFAGGVPALQAVSSLV